MTKEINSKERMQIIADNITYYRKLNGITQKELAEKIGIKPSTMTYYMKLISAPSYGIYNVSNSGTVNNKELLKEIRHLCKKYYKITSNSELTDKALSFNLPENTLLNTNKVIKEINLKNPSWQKSLEKYFKTNKK